MKFTKNSDSDYKAEDQGSAPQTKKKRKNSERKTVLLKYMNKKIAIQDAIKNFLPEGMALKKQKKISEAQYKDLLQCKDAPEFTLNYLIFLVFSYVAKVVKVIDGDTIKAIVLMNGKVETKFTFRLNGIDTPQIRKGQVKQFGRRVKEILTDMILGRMVKIQAGEFDKYGRVLARVYVYSNGEQLCLNDFVLKNDLAKFYSGKTKNEFSKQDWQYFQEKHQNSIWPKCQDYPLDKC